MTGFALLAFAVPAQAQVKVVGDWYGVLQSPVGPVTLIVTIGEGENGALRGDMESVDQGRGETSLTSITVGRVDRDSFQTQSDRRSIV